MVRIVYRWKVEKGREAEFRAAWAKATVAIRDTVAGARGSVLLQNHRDTCELVTIARWDTLEEWQAFWEDPLRSEMQAMHALAERLSAEAYEEVGDYTV